MALFRKCACDVCSWRKYIIPWSCPTQNFTAKTEKDLQLIKKDSILKYM